MILNKAALIVTLACATGMTLTSAKNDSDENHFLRKSDPAGALMVDAAIPESRKLPGCTTYCAIPISGLPTVLPGWPSGIQAEVDIRYGPQDQLNGDNPTVCADNNIQWRLDLRDPSSPTTNYFETPYRTLAQAEICSTGIVVTSADYCTLTMPALPVATGWGDVGTGNVQPELDIRYGPQNLVAGNQVLIPADITIQWRMDLNDPSTSTNYFETPYRTLGNACGSTGILVNEDDDYCTLTVPALPVATGWGDVGSGNIQAEVDIRYGPQNLVEGDEVLIPADITIQWRMDLNDPSTTTDYFETPYRTLINACASDGILVTEGEDYCEITIGQLPQDSPLVGWEDFGGVQAEVDIRYGPQSLRNGDTVLLPMGYPKQWRMDLRDPSSTANYFETPYRTLAAQDLCYGIRVTGMDQLDYCEVSISGLPEGGLPGWPSDIRAEVDIRYGPQNLQNGDKVLLPVGSDKQWRLDLRKPGTSTNYFETPYRTLDKEDLCTGIVVTGDDFCTLTMPALPVATGWGGVGSGGVRAEVDIRYGPQNLVENDEVLIPADINIQWRMDLREPGSTTNYFETPYRTLSNACASGPFVVANNVDYCIKEIDYTGSELDIRYGPQDLSDGVNVLFPEGIQVQHRIDSASYSSVTIVCPDDGLFP